MGQSVSSVIRAVPGVPCHEKRREAEDVLNAMVAVAEDKARIHQKKVANCPIDGSVLPVEKVLGKLYMIHCGIEKDAKRVKEVMRECLGERVKGDVIDGLAAVALRSVERMTDVVDGKKSSELMSYTIMLGKNGGIGRLDCYFFYYRFGSQTIASAAKDCLITSLVFSSVDATRLRADDIPHLVLPAYSQYLPDEPREAPLRRLKSIEKQLLDELHHAPRHIRFATSVSPEQSMNMRSISAGRR